MRTVIALLVATSLSVFAPTQAADCNEESFEQLKQLAGDWHVHKDENLAGVLRMRVFAGECALLEEWEPTSGPSAIALHWPEQTEPEEEAEEDESETFLEQLYIDASGWVMKARGTIKHGVLVYEGKTILEGEEIVLRATIHGLGTDAIVHIIDVSKDDGATWQRVSTLNYSRAEN